MQGIERKAGCQSVEGLSWIISYQKQKHTWTVVVIWKNIGHHKCLYKQCNEILSYVTSLLTNIRRCRAIEQLIVYFYAQEYVFTTRIGCNLFALSLVFCCQFWFFSYSFDMWELVFANDKRNCLCSPMKITRFIHL